jgi:hypothetical protein
VQGPLSKSGRAIRDVLDGLCRTGHRVGAGKLHRLRRATQRLDALADLAGVVLRLLEVLLQALLVRRAGGHLDVRGQRGLQLLLLPVRLVQVLDELYVFCLEVFFRHVSGPFPFRSHAEMLCTTLPASPRF